MNDLGINFLIWCERFGVPVGLIVVFLPIAYDLIGIVTRRDFQIKVETLGVFVQIFGFVLIALGKYAKSWGRK